MFIFFFFLHFCYQVLDINPDRWGVFCLLMKAENISFWCFLVFICTGDTKSIGVVGPQIIGYMWLQRRYSNTGGKVGKSGSCSRCRCSQVLVVLISTHFLTRSATAFTDFNLIWSRPVFVLPPWLQIVSVTLTEKKNEQLDGRRTKNKSVCDGPVEETLWNARWVWETEGALQPTSRLSSSES